jgi:NTP pyrophosphatase (non-canonical NTP hydrolase)
MNFTRYSMLALRTAKKLQHRLQLQHAQMGMISESGELADMVKRQFVYGKELDIVNGKEELGDFCWYLNLYCYEQGIDPESLDNAVRVFMPQGDGLVDKTLLLGALAGALAIDEKDRGSPDKMTVLALMPTLCQLAWHFDTTIYSALELNIDKLAKRYGDKYSDYAALNRDLVGERAVLEGGTEVDILID